MKFVCATAIAICVLSLGCEGGDTLPAEYAGAAWVAIDPAQCLSNPWERNWLAQDGHEYQDYPKDSTQPGLEPEEYEIIREYYLRQGVLVLDSATFSWDQVVCLACSCPEGHTLYLLVPDRDVETMVGFGYRLEDPPPAVSRSIRVGGTTVSRSLLTRLPKRIRPRAFNLQARSEIGQRGDLHGT